MGAAFEKLVEWKWRDVLNVVVTEPSRWDAKGSRPERTKPDKAQPEKAAVEKVTGLAGKATKIVGLANVVATNPGH